MRLIIFGETAVILPQFLHDQGIRHIITPLPTKTGQLWTRLGAFTVILYPFVDGRNGCELKLSAAQWVAFGAALKKLHTLVDGRDTLYIVDWDDPLLAPKERDLMFIGGAQGFVGYTTQEEETLFYRGYGREALNPQALAYYRYERIIEDIALYCEQLLYSTTGGQDPLVAEKNLTEVQTRQYLAEKQSAPASKTALLDFYRQRTQAVAGYQFAAL